MKDQEYAKKILEHRNRGGYSIRHAFRSLLKVYLLSAILIFIILYIISLCPRGTAPLWALLGMLIGAVLRDFGWFLAIKKTWPFSEKITDWNKVERLAQGEDIPS